MTAPLLPGPATVMRLPSGPWTAPVTQALRAGALVAAAEVGVLELSGPGAVTCLQGLLTNDIEQAGDGAFVYGALLTPKGMIVVDGWAARIGTTVRFTVPVAGRARASAIFARSVPPRLARTTDRTAETAVLRLAGAHALAIAEAARLQAPTAPGRVIVTAIDGASCEIARAGEDGPFVLQIATAPEDAARIAARLVTTGALAVDPAALELARIVAGWPGLTAEVDERTLPQEVRFDAIGGVSYTKGCYTGQETVSRLHFRGHTNRELVGVEFDAEPGPGETLPIILEDRDVGRVSSVAWLPEGGAGGATSGRWIGLGMVRREAELGARVRAGGVGAHIVKLPFVLPRWEPA
ncbi:MAG: YgfZ/GcvT domain-containing protein [Gemmatimonadales bacterium]